MNNIDLEKEVSKEFLKKIIENSNYMPSIKEDLKTIVDTSDTGEEAFEKTFAYFALSNINRK